MSTGSAIARKLLRAAAGLVIAAGAVLGVFSLFASAKEYPSSAPGGPQGQLKGAYHVHTTASDGRGDLSQIARAARAAGLAFVVVTDHNLQTLPPPRYLDGVLLVHGVEESTPWGHLVVLNVARPLTAAERSRDPVGTARALGGVSILAHPVQRRNPWRDWDAGAHAQGFELFSGDTMLRQVMADPARLVCAAGSYLANPTHGLMLLVRPHPEAVAKLLESSKQAPKVALCAVDAHGAPPYEAVFRMLATYLPAELTQLASDPQLAAQQVIAALAEGRTYCSFEALGAAAGFELEGLREGRVAYVGERLPLKLPWGGGGELRVRIAGAASFDADAGTILLEGPGAVALQIERLTPACTLGEEWRPWIVPSPIWVLAPDGGS